MLGYVYVLPFACPAPIVKSGHDNKGMKVGTDEIGVDSEVRWFSVGPASNLVKA